MTSISDVIGKIHFLTSVALEQDPTRNSNSKSKCICCAVDTKPSTVNFFETYGQRLKTLFGVSFKERDDTAPVGPNIQSLESLWSVCDLCLKQLEVAELLFWKIFRTHDIEVLVSTLDDGRELYQLRQDGVALEGPCAANNYSSGLIMDAPGDSSGSPPAKKARRAGQLGADDNMLDAGDENNFTSLVNANEPTDGDDMEYASLVQCDFCSSFVLELGKATLRDHRRTCSKNPNNLRRDGGGDSGGGGTTTVGGGSVGVVESMRSSVGSIDESFNEVESMSFWVCHTCSAPVKTEELLRQHYVTVHKECPEDLSKNKTVSTNVCPWCTAPFQTAKAKKRHICVRRPGSKAMETKNSSMPEAESQQFKCKYCSLLFPSARSRFNHFYRAHNRYK